MSSFTDAIINHFSYILSETLRELGLSQNEQDKIRNAFRSKVQNEYKYIQRTLSTKSR